MSIYNPNGPPLFGPGTGWNIPPMGGKNSAPTNPGASSPGLITSTGGLFGQAGLLLIPFFDFRSGKYYLATWDASNFNTEEDVFYYFRQENVKQDRAITNHKIVVTYRNLGIFTVTFFLTTFRKGLTTYEDGVAIEQQGTYHTVSKTLTLGTKNPDGKLYTIDFNLVNEGIRPQIYCDRKAMAGPMSITSVLLAGTMNEDDKV